jgi:hypothetical protein
VNERRDIGVTMVPDEICVLWGDGEEIFLSSLKALLKYLS